MRGSKRGGSLLQIEEGSTRGAHIGHSRQDTHKNGSVPVDPQLLKELLKSAGLAISGSGNRTIGGVQAAVATASKPIENPAAEDGKGNAKPGDTPQ